MYVLVTCSFVGFTPETLRFLFGLCARDVCSVLSIFCLTITIADERYRFKKSESIQVFSLSAKVYGMKTLVQFGCISMDV